jgi:hypothetical protein
MEEQKNDIFCGSCREFIIGEIYCTGISTIYSVNNIVVMFKVSVEMYNI